MVRSTSSLLAVALALVLAGCPTPAPEVEPPKDTTPEDPEPPVGDDDDDDDVTTETFALGGTGTTDPCGGGNPSMPGTLAVGYQFGYDSQARTTTSVTLDAGTGNPLTIAPSIDVHLGTDTWNGDTTQVDLFCTLTLTLDNAQLDPAFGAADPRHLVAFAYDISDPVLTDCFDCLGFDLAPGYFGTDFGTVMASSGDFGVAIGDVDPYTSSVLGPYLTATLLPSDLVGGTYRDGYFLAGDIPEVYGFAWRVDAAFNVVLDNNLLLQAMPYNQVDLGNNAASAWYDMNLLFYYIFN